MLINVHFSLLHSMCLIRSLRFWRQQLSITQQFGASMFHTVVCSYKLGKLEMSAP